MAYSYLWKELPPQVQKNFEILSKDLHYKRGERIYLQGDQPKGLYFVQSGLVGLTITGMSSGKEHLMRFFKQGQYFGHRSLFSNENYHATAITIENTHLKLIPKNVVLKTLEEHPQLYREVVSVLSKELRRCEQQRILILENQIISRTAQSLIYLKDLHPEHNWTRQEIANFCASTVSTIIKALAQLEEMGFISQDGRSIHILNREGLLNLQDQDDPLVSKKRESTQN